MLNCTFIFTSFQTELFSLTSSPDYRWFPEGKVVFVAPTKPLVAQQIDACHQICGIPGGDAAELTGQTHRLLRAKAVSLPLGSDNRFDVKNAIVGRKACLLHDSTDIHERSSNGKL